LILATRNPSETVAAGEVPTAGTPLMEHPALIHQPIVSNKLSCGWTTFTQPVRPGLALHAIARR
jgi:hypothetical protein